MAATVSIVLPTFNRLGYLRFAVASVFAQTFQDWELIIADDGSGEETAAYLAGIVRLPRVTLLRLPHSGRPSIARNAALRAARGRYVSFLDSDDLWLPGKLEIQLSAHKACSARRWSYTALKRIDARGEPMLDGFGLHSEPFDGAIFEPLLTMAAVIATPSVLAERRLIEEAGGFDEQQHFYEDYDLWMRLSLLSEVICVREPLVLIRNHDSHYSADRSMVYKARVRLLDKMGSYVRTDHLRSVLSIEHAKNAADLALTSAVAGHRIGALKMLWHSRKCAWRQRGWWRKAGLTLAFALTPGWLRNSARRIKRRRARVMSSR